MNINGNLFTDENFPYRHNRRHKAAEIRIKRAGGKTDRILAQTFFSKRHQKRASLITQRQKALAATSFIT